MRTLFLAILLVSFNALAIVVKPVIDDALNTKYESTQEQERELASEVEEIEEVPAENYQVQERGLSSPGKIEVAPKKESGVKFWDY